MENKELEKLKKENDDLKKKIKELQGDLKKATKISTMFSVVKKTVATNIDEFIHREKKIKSLEKQLAENNKKLAEMEEEKEREAAVMNASVDFSNEKKDEAEKFKEESINEDNIKDNNNQKKSYSNHDLGMPETREEALKMFFGNKINLMDVAKSFQQKSKSNDNETSSPTIDKNNDTKVEDDKIIETKEDESTTINSDNSSYKPSENNEENLEKQKKKLSDENNKKNLLNDSQQKNRTQNLNLQGELGVKSLDEAEAYDEDLAKEDKYRNLMQQQNKESKAKAKIKPPTRPGKLKKQIENTQEKQGQNDSKIILNQNNEENNFNKNSDSINKSDDIKSEEQAVSLECTQTPQDLSNKTNNDFKAIDNAEKTKLEPKSENLNNSNSQKQEIINAHNNTAQSLKNKNKVKNNITGEDIKESTNNNVKENELLNEKGLINSAQNNIEKIAISDSEQNIIANTTPNTSQGNQYKKKNKKRKNNNKKNSPQTTTQKNKDGKEKQVTDLRASKNKNERQTQTSKLDNVKNPTNLNSNSEKEDVSEMKEENNNQKSLNITSKVSNDSDAMNLTINENKDSLNLNSISSDVIKNNKDNDKIESNSIDRISDIQTDKLKENNESIKEIKKDSNVVEDEPKKEYQEHKIENTNIFEKPSLESNYEHNKMNITKPVESVETETSDASIDEYNKIEVTNDSLRLNLSSTLVDELIDEEEYQHIDNIQSNEQADCSESNCLQSHSNDDKTDNELQLNDDIETLNNENEDTFTDSILALTSETEVSVSELNKKYKVVPKDEVPILTDVIIIKLLSKKIVNDINVLSDSNKLLNDDSLDSNSDLSSLNEGTNLNKISDNVDNEKQSSINNDVPIIDDFYIQKELEKAFENNYDIDIDFRDAQTNILDMDEDLKQDIPDIKNMILEIEFDEEGYIDEDWDEWDDDNI